MSNFTAAAVLAGVLVAYNPEILTPYTAPAAAMTAYAIREVGNMNYAASLLGSPAVPVHNCEDTLQLITDLNVPEVLTYQDPLIESQPHRLNCIVEVAGSQAQFQLYI